ncbi:mevalonate kinase [Neptuniibacter sp.]|uniref:mevalonate kinase family protein n=1 Tax=Neptuniibacter sp. TaxID=1962643 RepID=UPI0026148381|nr:mevalonate kinase [Neptuniibacter sp.]MCP4596953.1 mevalonate kinase [Neptuniibacter sp.]
MKAKAPGKLILSGEHSVVYGAPAIAVAVEQSVTAAFTPHDTNSLTIHSYGLGIFKLKTSELQSLVELLDQRFQRFISDQISISELLDSPGDLLFYTLAQSGFKSSGQIDIKSDIPTGSGMGSSAAVIAALSKLAESSARESSASFNSDLDNLFTRVRYCERLQHGRGSAIDAAAVTYGGVIKVVGGHVSSLPINLDQNWYTWSSGTPDSTTGETVAAVRQKHASSDIWDKFKVVTETFEKALKDKKPSRILEQIRCNSQLLEQIGVVPKPVEKVIREIERLGGAAKICGAGSIQGESGGQVLVYLPDLNVNDISRSLQICLEPLKPSYHGACLEKD